MHSIWTEGLLALEFMPSDVSAGRPRWVFPGYMHLTTLRATVIPLEMDTDVARCHYAEALDAVAVVAHPAPSFGAMSWYRFLEDFNFTAPWSVNFWRLSQRRAHLPFDFLPGHMILERVSGAETFSFSDQRPAAGPRRRRFCTGVARV